MEGLEVKRFRAVYPSPELNDPLWVPRVLQGNARWQLFMGLVGSGVLERK